MARRRKPINFDLLTSGDKDELLRVVEDLRKKRPCGPAQDLHAEDYENYYNDARLKDSIQENRNVRASGGGYTNYQLYQIAKTLGVEGTYVDEWAVRRSLVENVYGYEMSPAARTRRTNRIVERLRGGYRDAIRNGDIGDSVFSVSMSKYNENGSGRTDYRVRVVAKTDNEATTIASTLFGYALGEVRCSEFVKEGNASDTMIVNEDARKRTVRQIEEKQKAIAKLQAGIADLEAAGEAISMYSISAFAGGECASEDI